MITKDLFVKIIKDIKEQLKIDEEFSDALEKVCDGNVLFGTNNKNLNNLLLLLKETFEDKDDWISWWIWENKFGKGNLKVFTAKKKEIKLETTEDLYKMLISNTKNRNNK